MSSAASRQLEVYTRQCLSVPSAYGVEPSLKIGGRSINTSNIPLISLPSVTAPPRRELSPPDPSSYLSVPTLASQTSSDAMLSVQTDKSSLIGTPRNVPSVRSSSSVFATPNISTVGTMQPRVPIARAPTIESVSGAAESRKVNTGTRPIMNRIPSIRSGNKPETKAPKISDEVDRIVADTEPAPKVGRSAYELGNVIDAGKPDFSKMSRNHRLAYKQTLIQELKDLQFKYPNLAIPEVSSELSLDELYDIHYAALKHVVVTNSLGTWKVGLVLCWAAFELTCTHMFNIPAKGYTDMMYAEMIKYEILIYRWREKKFSFASAEKDPLNELLWCSLLNAGIIIAINLLGKYMGSDIVSTITKSIVLPITNSMTHPKVSLPGVPAPVDSGLMSSIESGLRGLMGYLKPPPGTATTSTVTATTTSTSTTNNTQVKVEEDIFYDT